MSEPTKDSGSETSTIDANITTGTERLQLWSIIATVAVVLIAVGLIVLYLNRQSSNESTTGSETTQNSQYGIAERCQDGQISLFLLFEAIRTGDVSLDVGLEPLVRDAREDTCLDYVEASTRAADLLKQITDADKAARSKVDKAVAQAAGKATPRERLNASLLVSCEQDIDGESVRSEVEVVTPTSPYELRVIADKYRNDGLPPKQMWSRVSIENDLRDQIERIYQDAWALVFADFATEPRLSYDYNRAVTQFCGVSQTSAPTTPPRPLPKDPSQDPMYNVPSEETYPR